MKLCLPRCLRRRVCKCGGRCRADIIVEGTLLLELKSVENIAPVHSKQVLTYLKLLNLPLGLLINFGAATIKEGIKRISNNHQNFASSRLRVNQRP